MPDRRVQNTINHLLALVSMAEAPYRLNTVERAAIKIANGYTRILQEAANLLEEQALLLEETRAERDDYAAAVYRVAPNCHTVGDNPDPFEGPGETYCDAYLRESARANRLANEQAYFSICVCQLSGECRVIRFDYDVCEICDGAKSATAEVVESILRGYNTQVADLSKRNEELAHKLTTIRNTLL